MRRASIVALLLTMVLGVAGISEASGTVALPTSRIAFDSNRTGNYEIFTMGTDGTSPQQLTSDPAWDSWWAKLSPDRTRILFYRTPAGTHDRDYKQTSLWVMNADGTGLTRLLANGAYGWQFSGHAEWSPDGAHLAMLGGPKSPQIFITDASGANPRQVTSRPGNNVDPSWSPDGRSLLFVGCPVSVCTSQQYEVYSVNTDGTGERRLTNDAARDQDPYYAPDGHAIAWLRQTEPAHWGIYVMRPDGAEQRGLVADLQINSKPAWSADSGAIYFHRLPLGRTSFNIFRVNSDGTGLTELQTRPVVGPGPYANEYPVASSF
jgi:TolB protein